MYVLDLFLLLFLFWQMTGVGAKQLPAILDACSRDVSPWATSLMVAQQALLGNYTAAPTPT